MYTVSKVSDSHSVINVALAGKEQVWRNFYCSHVGAQKYAGTQDDILYCAID